MSKDYIVVVNNTKIIFHSFNEANKYFSSMPNIFKVALYDSTGLLINKNYNF